MGEGGGAESCASPTRPRRPADGSHLSPRAIFVSSSLARPPLDQSRTSMPLSEVPKISLRDFESRREQIKEQLIAASSDIGFLYVAASPDVKKSCS